MLSTDMKQYNKGRLKNTIENNRSLYNGYMDNDLKALNFSLGDKQIKYSDDCVNAISKQQSNVQNHKLYETTNETDYCMS